MNHSNNKEKLNMFIKGLTYTAEELQNNYEDYNMTSFGANAIGENFIVLNHYNKDIAHSFVLTGANSNLSYMYECVYTDTPVN